MTENFTTMFVRLVIKLHNIFSYFLKQIVLFYCGNFSFQYLDGIDDFTVIDEIDAIFVNINKIINEIINNHETEIINFSTNAETKKLICWVNYDKLQQKLYKKYTVNGKHDQISDKNNIFSKAILLPYIHNFFLQHYNNFTLDIQDMI